jgi:hypothetical protein
VRAPDDDVRSAESCSLPSSPAQPASATGTERTAAGPPSASQPPPGAEHRYRPTRVRPTYGLHGSDNHYDEPRDCFTRHIEPKHRDKSIRVVADGDGHEVILVGDRTFNFLRHHSFDFASKPGALREMLQAMRSGAARTGESATCEPVRPEYVDRDARLALTDEQGIETCLLFPTLGVCVEHFMKDDVEQMYANLHASNLWLDEDWGFNHLGRIVGVPLMNLLGRDRGVEELELVLERGARAVALRPGPAFGRSPADPYFDPPRRSPRSSRGSRPTSRASSRARRSTPVAAGT